MAFSDTSCPILTDIRYRCHYYSPIVSVLMPKLESPYSLIDSFISYILSYISKYINFFTSMAKEALNTPRRLPSVDRHYGTGPKR